MTEKVLKNPVLDLHLEQNRRERMGHILGGQFSFLKAVEKPRDYQDKTLATTMDNMRRGVVTGRWDVATGGGKTVMALSLANHIVNRGGRVLYLTPGNTELDNATNAHESYGLGENNYMVFHDGDDITDLVSPKYRKKLEGVRFCYSTTQMLCYQDRFKQLPADMFDLIIFDESHGFLGPILSGPGHHFQGAQLHMSATPFNVTKHVGDRIPHVFGSITSQELIERHKFPPWKVRNYMIDDRAPERPLPQGEDLDFESPELHNLLNIGSRFVVLEKICEEIVLGNRLGVASVPSVQDAELFVKYVVPRNPLLAGRVDFVAGKRGQKTNRGVEDRFRERKINVVLSKKLWDQAIDIPEITDIVLADPTRSLRILTQRIGRGVRPAAGKDELIVHDLVSSVFHSSEYGEPAIRADSLIASQQRNGQKSNGSQRRGARERAWSEVENVHPYFLIALENKQHDNLRMQVAEVEFRETLKETYFMADPKWATRVFAAFANQVFGVSYPELFLNFDLYADSQEQLKVTHNGHRVSLTLDDARKAAAFYGTYDSCAAYDYMRHIVDSGRGFSGDEESELLTEREDVLDTVGSIVQPTRARTLEKAPSFSEDINYLTSLNTFLQRNDKQFRGILWKEEYTRDEQSEPEYYFAITRISLNGKLLTVEPGSQLYRLNRQAAKQAAAHNILDQIKSQFPAYRDKIVFVKLPPNARGTLHSKEAPPKITRTSYAENLESLNAALKAYAHEITWSYEESEYRGEKICHAGVKIEIPSFGIVITVPPPERWRLDRDAAQHDVAFDATTVVKNRLQRAERMIATGKLVKPTSAEFSYGLDYVSTLNRILQPHLVGYEGIKWTYTEGLDAARYASATIEHKGKSIYGSSEPDRPRSSFKDSEQAAAARILENLIIEFPYFKDNLYYIAFAENSKRSGEPRVTSEFQPDSSLGQLGELLKSRSHKLRWSIVEQKVKKKKMYQASALIFLKDNGRTVAAKSPAEWFSTQQAARQATAAIAVEKIKEAIEKPPPSSSAETALPPIPEGGLQGILASDHPTDVKLQMLRNKGLISKPKQVIQFDPGTSDTGSFKFTAQIRATSQVVESDSIRFDSQPDKKQKLAIALDSLLSKLTAVE